MVSPPSNRPPLSRGDLATRDVDPECGELSCSSRSQGGLRCASNPRPAGPPLWGLLRRHLDSANHVGDLLPFALLGFPPVARPADRRRRPCLQGVGGVPKRGEEAFHRRAPGSQNVDRLHATQSVIPQLFQSVHTVPVEDLMDLGADQRLVLVCRHDPCSSPRIR
jgi:hypothetical protein